MQTYDAALEKFKQIIVDQMERVQKIKQNSDFINYGALDCIRIGVIMGDGIGPFITNEAKRILAFLLQEQIKTHKIVLIDIDGLTIENRIKHQQAIPDAVLAEIKKCHVLLKGPTETPNAESKINIESANVKMRKELDLFANVRPVCVDELGIDWTFFRENTEGAYAVGNRGFDINDDLALDFTVATTQGSRRIIKAAFEFAVKNNKKRVTAVTKANIIKTTDGKFLKIFKEIASQYPNIEIDDWYIDIMTAKLLDKKRRSGFEVLVMPNLYGDILTDEAAEIQGGVGTAGSANIGSKYAMFEAIHGSAPRMVTEGRGDYADPRSIIRAAGMLLAHIGFADKAVKLTNAMNVVDKKTNITGRVDGHSGQDYANLLIEYLKNDTKTIK